MTVCQWSFRDFENVHHQEGTILPRVATWLVDTALFEQAWSTVCVGPLQWWWSEQLCLFTAGGFTVFLFTQRECKRLLLPNSLNCRFQGGRVPHVWAYMLLGQVVAISVAWSLLNLALVLIPRPRAASNVGKAHLPVTLTVPVLLSLLTVSVSPYTTSTTFLPNLLVMHALPIVPLLPLPFHTPLRLSPRSTSFYTLVALLSTILRLRTTFAMLSLLHVTSSPFFSLQYPVDAIVALWNAPGIVFGAAWETLHTHPAQASIGWDVVWSSLVWIVWGMWGDRATEESRWTATDAVMNVFPVVVASVGVTAPMEFGRELRAGRLEDKNK